MKLLYKALHVLRKVFFVILHSDIKARPYRFAYLVKWKHHRINMEY